jgi:hypothetical protein
MMFFPQSPSNRICGVIARKESLGLPWRGRLVTELRTTMLENL